MQDFKEATHEEQPFLRENARHEIRRYAICPSCDNPIQIIGLLRENPNRKPYGRHTGRTIDGLPEWNYARYQYCPFASPDVRKEPDDSNEYKDIPVDARAVEFYNMVRDYFDIIVMVLSSELEIRAYAGFWRECLKIFVVNKGYCYPWLTDANLPYVFAYIAMGHHGIWQVKFKKGSELYRVMEQHPNIQFQEPDDAGYCRWNHRTDFIDLKFRLWNHKQKAKDGEFLQESVQFCLDEIRNGKAVNLFEKKLVFDEMAFQKRIRSVKKRQQWLLDLAASEMPDIRPTV